MRAYVYNALTEGTARALVADLVPEGQHGSAYGLFHAAVGFAALPASLIVGILWLGVSTWSEFGPQAPFFFGALVALATILLL